MTSVTAPILDLREVHKHYAGGAGRLHVLRGVTLLVEPGEFVAIVGASGSGKSTLLNILGCLDRPSSGEYFLRGRSVAQLPDDQLSEVRNRSIGFVFQSFQLVPQLTVLENVELPLYYRGVARAERHARALERLAAVGLEGRVKHLPSALSGGECQRTAIARALVGEPDLLLADEPTGNLDSKSGVEIMKVFRELNRRGKTIVLITHNPEIAARLPRVLHLRDGIMAEHAEAAAAPVAFEF
jgi:putative ABC transport system ATP-binding protein